MPERIKNNKEFPDQVNSLVYTRTVKSVSGRQFNFINFNHDLLAEQGIIYSEEAGDDLRLKVDEFEKKKLLDAICEINDPNTALMLCLWLYSKKKDAYIQKLKDIIKGNLALIKGSFCVYIIKLLPYEDKIELAQFILDQPDFLKLPHQIVSTALKVLDNDNTEVGKRAAKTILNQPDFFNLPKEIVSTALNLLGNTEEGKRAAKTILDQPDFFNLPNAIVSTALKLLGNTKEGKKAAKIILKRGLNEQPFLLFNALKQLALSNRTEEENQLVIAFLNNLNSKIRSKKGTYKGIYRLYHDILYLPLMEFTVYKNRVFGIIKNYRTDLQRGLKEDIYKVLKCYSDYPQITYFNSEIETLCLNILQNWQIDIQYQLKHHSDNLMTLHINQSLIKIDLVNQELAKKRANELIYFAERKENAQFKNHPFYKTAVEIYGKS